MIESLNLGDTFKYPALPRYLVSGLSFRQVHNKSHNGNQYLESISSELLDMDDFKKKDGIFVNNLIFAVLKLIYVSSKWISILTHLNLDQLLDMK